MDAPTYFNEIFGLAGAALTFNEAVAPDYFDTAGKYIHSL